MPLTPNEKRNYVLLAVKLAEAAVSSDGTHAFLYPDQVTGLIEQVATKIQGLMENAEK